MKSVLKLTVFAAALAFVLSALFASAASVPSTAPGTWEIIECKVLKVFSADDEGAIFRAYLVEYKGQEVIASDALAKTHYRTDDVITVQVMKNPFPQGREPYNLLHFIVITPRAKSSIKR